VVYAFYSVILVIVDLVQHAASVTIWLMVTTVKSSSLILYYHHDDDLSNYFAIIVDGSAVPFAGGAATSR
jgi:hypothetical protein